LQLTFAVATGAVAVAVGVAPVAVGQTVGVADTVAVGAAVALAVAVTVGGAVLVGVAVGGVWCLLCSGSRTASLVADTAWVIPAAGEADGELAGAAGVAAAADVAGAAAAAAAAAEVVAAAAAGDVAAAAGVVGVAEVAAVGVGQAPAPCAERLRLPDPPISFRPSTKPTTRAMARGTAIRAARALCDRADQCALRIQSTSVFAEDLNRSR
jgi:hypothetical protein